MDRKSHARPATPQAALYLALVLLATVETTIGFLPGCRSPQQVPTTRALFSSGPLLAGGKWKKDPTTASRIAELLQGFQQTQHELSEHPNRYMEDGMVAIRRHDPVQALDAFDKAMKADNETTLVWHRGAMLYYLGRYEEAVTHLERTVKQFEERMEQPATEEEIWKIAALIRLHGREKAVSLLEEPKFGGEKRFLMGLVYELFRGRLEPRQLADIIAQYSDNEFTSYDLYGNFYLGLFYDAMGWSEESMACMGKATQALKAKPSDIMYHLPRLHVIVRERKWAGN